MKHFMLCLHNLARKLHIASVPDLRNVIYSCFLSKVSDLIIFVKHCQDLFLDISARKKNQSIISIECSLNKLNF